MFTIAVTRPEKATTTNEISASSEKRSMRARRRASRSLSRRAATASSVTTASPPTHTAAPVMCSVRPPTARSCEAEPAAWPRLATGHRLRNARPRLKKMPHRERTPNSRVESTAIIAVAMSHICPSSRFVRKYQRPSPKLASARSGTAETSR
jgi:hypothetical protein